MELQSAIQNAVRKLEASELDAFEVAGLSDNTLRIEAKKQMVDEICRTRSAGIAVRAIKDERIGFAATTDIAPKSIEQMVKLAVASLKQIAKSEEALLLMPQGKPGEISEKAGRPFDEIPDEEKVGIALALESEAIAADNRIVRVQHPCFEERQWTLAVVNSNGVDVRSQRQTVSCDLKAVASDGRDTEGAYEFEFSNRFEALDAGRVAKEAARRAVEKLGGGSMPAGKYPVLFSPKAAASMLKLAAPSFFADNIQRGKSALAGKKGERAYHPAISIVDDGLLPGGLGSFPFDGEGTPRRRTMMVCDGVIEGWLYDGPRAARDGVGSTGNSVRGGLRQMPAIGVGNCFIKGGQKSREALLKDAVNGLFITDLLGLHMANVISGDFSLGAEGFLIEGGALGAPVRGITVAGNIHDLFKRVAGTGDDLRFVSEYGAPSILIESLMIGA